MEEKDVVVNGKKVHYAVGGKGPVIVLVHGWANNWMGWVPLTNHLVNDFTVYAIDQMGYGKSDRLDNYSVDIQADYLAGFIKKLKLKPKITCGLSMGTFVVADFALRYPKLTEKVVLIGAVFPVGRRRRIVNSLLRKSFEAIDKHELSEAALKKLVERRIMGYISAKYFTMYKFNRFLIDAYGLVGRKQMSKEGFVQMGISISKYRLAKTINSLRQPVLLIFGSQDKFTNISQAKKILLLRSNFSFAEIEQSGHITSLEQPERVAKEINKFML